MAVSVPLVVWREVKAIPFTQTVSGAEESESRHAADELVPVAAGFGTSVRTLPSASIVTRSLAVAVGLPTAVAESGLGTRVRTLPSASIVTKSLAVAVGLPTAVADSVTAASCRPMTAAWPN